MKSESLFQYIDQYLGTAEHPDYPGAFNGVQVEGGQTVETVCAAVDASTETVAAAVKAGADLLIVHHGLFWGPSAPLTGRLLRRVRPLIQAEVALYSAHLPLDGHPEVGNCALLARAIGIEPEERFGEYEGVPIGWAGSADLDRSTLRERLAQAVDGPVQLLAGGADRIERVGIVTGGGAGFIRAAAEAGLDALVTGEGPHHSYLDATELGMNVFYAGHYATETFGVKALAQHVSDRFGLSWSFLDFPSGL